MSVNKPCAVGDFATAASSLQYKETLLKYRMAKNGDGTQEK